MKFFVAIALVTIIGVTSAALTEELKQELKTYHKECTDATPGFDKSLIEKAKKGEYPDNDKLGAFLKCYGDKLEFFKSDGSYNTPVIKEKVGKKVDSDVSAVVDKCVEKDEKDPIKNALHLAKCLYENIPKHDDAL